MENVSVHDGASGINWSFNLTRFQPILCFIPIISVRPSVYLFSKAKARKKQCWWIVYFRHFNNCYVQL